MADASYEADASNGRRVKISSFLRETLPHVPYSDEESTATVAKIVPHAISPKPFLFLAFIL